MLTLNCNVIEESEIDFFLNDQQPISKHVRISKWFDKKNWTEIFGIQAKIEGKWINVCHGERALLFNEQEIAKTFKKKLTIK